MKVFDQRLYELEMREPILRMQREMIERRFHSSDDEVLFRGWGASPKDVDCDTSVVCDFLEDVDKVCRKVWESDGETVTSAFIREELRPRVFSALSDSEESMRRTLSADSKNAHVPTHLLEHFEKKMSDLKSSLSNRYEIEAIKLAKRESRSAPMTQLPAATPAARPFAYSQDYRSISVRGRTYTLTSQQAQMIEILHKAHENGTPDISIAHILERLEKKTSCWQDTFKSNPNARKALVKSGARRGTLRLNL